MSSVPTDTIRLAAAADTNYAMPLAVMLFSAARHLPPDIGLHVHVVGNGLSRRSRYRVERCLRAGKASSRISWLEVDPERLAGCAVSAHISETAYCRILLPELLPQVDRLLYLDCDLLIRTSIEPLWRIGEQDSQTPIWAVQGFGAPYAACRYGIPGYESFGISAEAPCFNSGVLLMNLDVWRREKIGSRVWELAPKGDAPLEVLHDQFALNVALAGKWKQLNPSWNRMNTIERFHAWEEGRFKAAIADHYDELLADPAVVHFTGPRKPWQPGGGNHRFSSEYDEAVDASGWFKGPCGRLQRWWRRVQRQRHTRRATDQTSRP